MSRKLWPALAAAAVLTVGVAARGGSDDSADASGDGALGTIAGAGSSAQQAAQEAWTAKVRGRELRRDDLLRPDRLRRRPRSVHRRRPDRPSPGSDSPFDTDELPKATQRMPVRGGELVQIPNYISPIAIVYNLPGVDSLQLTPDTTAKIFRGEITKWNDPAIAADNPGADLPRHGHHAGAPLRTSPARRRTSRTISMRLPPKRLDGRVRTAAGR